MRAAVKKWERNARNANWCELLEESRWWWKLCQEISGNAEIFNERGLSFFSTGRCRGVKVANYLAGKLRHWELTRNRGAHSAIVSYPDMELQEKQLRTSTIND